MSAIGDWIHYNVWNYNYYNQRNAKVEIGPTAPNLLLNSKHRAVRGPIYVSNEVQTIINNRRSITDTWIRELANNEIRGQLENAIQQNLDAILLVREGVESEENDEAKRGRELMQATAEELSTWGKDAQVILQQMTQKSGGITAASFKHLGTSGKSNRRSSAEKALRDYFNNVINEIGDLADTKKLSHSIKSTSANSQFQKLITSLIKIYKNEDSSQRRISMDNAIQEYQNRLLTINFDNLSETKQNNLKEMFGKLLDYFSLRRSATQLAGSVGEYLTADAVLRIKNLTHDNFSKIVTGDKGSRRGVEENFFLSGVFEATDKDDNTILKEYSAPLEEGGTFRLRQNSKKNDISDVTIEATGISVKSFKGKEWDAELEKMVDTKQKISFKHEGGFLQLIQNENTNNFINHYLNLAVHAKKMGGSAQQEFNDATWELKRIALIKIISGKSFMTESGEMQQSQLFVAIDTSNYTVRVFNTGDLIEYILKVGKSNLFNRSLDSVIKTLSDSNKYVGTVPSIESGTQRIANLLKRIDSINIRAQIKFMTLFNSGDDIINYNDV